MDEKTVELAALGWLRDQGYALLYGPEIGPDEPGAERQDYEHVVLEPRVRAALRKINEHLPEDAIEQAVRVVTRPPEPTLEQNNRWFHRLLTDGIDVEYRMKDGETRGDKAWLVDFANPTRNDLLVVNQFTVKCGNYTRRADLVVFLNGLPVAVIELKDPTDEQADVWKAYRQLQNYKQHVPPLFTYNELLVISDGDSTRVGSLTAGTDRFSPWRSIEDYYEPGQPHLETLIKGLFEPTLLLDYLRHCVTFEEDERTGDISKKVAGYHQFRAVKSARTSVKAALKPPAGKGDGRDAVQTYTQAGGEGDPVEELQEQAVPLMQKHAEALRDFFNGFDYSGFAGGSEAAQLRAVTAGADYVFEQHEGKRRFMTMVAALSKAFALAVPREETQAVRDDLAYFQSVRAAIRKRLSDDGAPSPPDTRAAVRQVISGAIASDGVIDLFQAAGLAEPNVAILSEDFLERLAALPHKNLALETLRKLLNDQIRSRERVNIVQSRTFRESLESVLTRYTNRAITTAQVIEELIGLAREIREAVKRGEESGLSEEEVAFYDALADNQSAREVMQDDTLRLIARELSDRIKAKASLDWTQRETVRADMRRTIRRLLSKYGYPPDAQEAATQLVIRQAELMAEGIVSA